MTRKRNSRSPLKSTRFLRIPSSERLSKATRFYLPSRYSNMGEGQTFPLRTIMGSLSTNFVQRPNLTAFRSPRRSHASAKTRSIRCGSNCGVNEPNNCERFFATWRTSTSARLTARFGSLTPPRGSTARTLLAVWTHYGRQPTCRQMDDPPSAISSGAYKKKWGTWWITSFPGQKVGRLSQRTSAHSVKRAISERVRNLKRVPAK